MNNIVGQRVAVIMGDLVKSESSQPLELLYRQFNLAIEAKNAVHVKALLSPMTITLGDEFQGLVRSLSEAVAIARDLRLQLLSSAIDCRFVIGIVDIKTPINSKHAWNMMGPGLSKARAKLNEKKIDQFYRFSLPENPTLEIALEALGAGLSIIERDWTEQQCKDISSLIGGLSPNELAHQRNVSVHSIYKVRSSGDFDVYKMLWHAIRETLGELDEQWGVA